jgi:hypothetical protein
MMCNTRECTCHVVAVHGIGGVPEVDDESESWTSE